MTTAYDDSILRSLRRINRAIYLYSRQLANRCRITGPQLICLRQLAGDGPTTPGFLASQISLSQATVTGILDRMEARGLVTRQRNPEDKRRVIVDLTPAGRELLKDAPMPLQEQFARRLAELSDEKQAEIDRVLRQVVSMMEAEKIDAAPILETGPMGGDPAEVSVLINSDSKVDEPGNDASS